jgi:hypothetical protein
VAAHPRLLLAVLVVVAASLPLAPACAERPRSAHYNVAGTEPQGVVSHHDTPGPDGLLELHNSGDGSSLDVSRAYRKGAKTPRDDTGAVDDTSADTASPRDTGEGAGE